MGVGCSPYAEVADTNFVNIWASGYDPCSFEKPIIQKNTQIKEIVQTN